MFSFLQQPVLHPSCRCNVVSPHAPWHLGSCPPAPVISSPSTHRWCSASGARVRVLKHGGSVGHPHVLCSHLPSLAAAGRAAPACMAGAGRSNQPSEQHFITLHVKSFKAQCGPSMGRLHHHSVCHELLATSTCRL